MTPSLIREGIVAIALVLAIVAVVIGARANIRKVAELKAENAALTLKVQRAEALRAKSDKAVARAVTRERQAQALAAEKTRALDAALATAQEWRDTTLPPAVLEALK